MIKKELTTIDFDSSGNDVERTILVRFLYSLKAIKLYEERYQTNFFDEYEQAVKRFGEMFKGVGVAKVSELSPEEQTQLLPIMADKVILNFLARAIPCIYGEVENGKFIQSTFTAENAEMSDWFGELLNVQFLGEIMREFSSNSKNVPQDKKKPQRK